MSAISTEVAVFLVGVTAVNLGALLNFVISTSVRIGKLETRVDFNERDINNLGAMVRNEKHERKAA